MTRWIGTAAAAVVAILLLVPPTNAQQLQLFRHPAIDPRIDAVGLGVGVASTVGYFALNGWRFERGHATTGLGTNGAFIATTAGCMVASPIVATAVVQRPLTYREAHVLVVGCIVPIIGPWLVNAAYDAHPEWAAFDAPAARAMQPPPRPRPRRR